jgi:hypothetical protein
VDSRREAHLDRRARGTPTRGDFGRGYRIDGYSRLVGADEVGTLLALKAARPWEMRRCGVRRPEPFQLPPFQVDPRSAPARPL